MSLLSRKRSSFSFALTGIVAGFLSGVLLFSALAPAISKAQQATLASTSTLQAQIDSTNAQISDLQKQIAELQQQLTATSKQKQTLQNAITALNLNIQKITASITLTQTEINQKDIEIAQLGHTIATTSSAMDVERTGASAALRNLSELDNEPFILNLLAGGTLSQFFDQEVALSNVQNALQQHITALSNLKDTLTTTKNATEDARLQLATLQQTLGSQKQGLVTARVAQSQLLTETKNKESNYQSLLAQKKQQEAQFESQLNDYQAQLKSVSASAVPLAGALLSWPLAHTSITQYFGNTPFATANPQVYNGHGHSGIDLAASPGTPVMAAADGVVTGTGNTDLTAPNASFGKWVFIKHDNGLGTIYAHLGSIGVSQGQRVTRGQVIGYSDTTGYATGPHLHFGVYVASAVIIQQLPTAARQLVIPVAPLSAYLNPLTYLPPTVP